MSLTRIAIMLAVVVAIVGGVHFYFWARLVRDTALPHPFRAWAGAALVALAVSLPLSLLIGRVLPPSLRTALSWPVFIWMGLMFVLLVVLVGADLLRLGLHIWRHHLAQVGPPTPERRLFLARLLGGAAGSAAGVLGAWGVYQATSLLRVKDVTVRLDKLSREKDGFVIAQLTDVHLGPTIGRAFCEEMVRRTNALEPDIVAITGDLVDGSVESLREAAAPLAGLRAKHGVFFVTGNHEYYSGVEPWLGELTRLGIRVLRNECVAIGEGEDCLDLAGVDDYTAHGFGNGHGADLPRALAGRRSERALVLLAHQPRQIHEAADLGVDLQISGHTHGGQIWPFNFLVKLQQPFVLGLWRKQNTQIYVSPGTGYWGPPLRIGTQAEITRIILRSSKALG